jgi:predicted outer membrane repeat protein
VIESSFTHNWAVAGRGGAISSVAAGVASGAGIQRSSFVGNHAVEGGAIVLGSSGTASNSTFLGNVATASGGAILAEGQSLKVLVYDTITANSAPEGANLTNRGHDLRVLFSVLAEPQGGPNCAFPQGEFHLTESRTDDASCPGARQVDDVLLGPLGHNGGPTVTRVPLAGSPLIDAIDANYGYPSIPGGCAGFVGIGTPDQRGVERPQDGDGRSRSYQYAGQTYQEAADCDIGAVEADAVVVRPTGPVAGGPSFTG